MSNSFKAVYGHGYRMGMALSPAIHRGLLATLQAPTWMPSRLHRFVWFQGLRNGAGFPTIISILTNSFLE